MFNSADDDDDWRVTTNVKETEQNQVFLILTESLYRLTLVDSTAVSYELQ